jgi:hypothetical protein
MKDGLAEFIENQFIEELKLYGMTTSAISVKCYRAILIKN